MSETKDIPRILDSKFTYRIINDGGPRIYSRNTYKDDSLLDMWGEPIIFMLTTNRNGDVGFTMHSFGKNKIDEKGGGDDIIMWFDADMFYPKFKKK